MLDVRARDGADRLSPGARKNLVLRAFSVNRKRAGRVAVRRFLDKRYGIGLWSRLQFAKYPGEGECLGPEQGMNAAPLAAGAGKVLPGSDFVAAHGQESVLDVGGPITEGTSIGAARPCLPCRQFRAAAMRQRRRPSRWMRSW